MIPKICFSPWKIGLTKWSKYLLCAYLFWSGWYLFQSILHYLESIELQLGQKGFVSVIINLSSSVELVITQGDDQLEKD